tara:strand:+ start:17 stop:760 length:744 start_codon:yes stop_codon:yes gene_type:complete
MNLISWETGFWAVIGFIGTVLSRVLAALLTDYIKSDKGKEKMAKLRKFIFSFDFLVILFFPFVSKKVTYYIFKRQCSDDTYVFGTFGKLFFISFAALIFSLVVRNITPGKFVPEGVSIYLQENIYLVWALELAIFYLSVLIGISTFKAVDLYNGYQRLITCMGYIMEKGCISKDEYFRYYFSLSEIIKRSDYNEYQNHLKSLEKAAEDLALDCIVEFKNYKIPVINLILQLSDIQYKGPFRSDKLPY